MQKVKNVDGQFLLFEIREDLEKALHSALNDKSLPSQGRIYLATRRVGKMRLKPLLVRRMRPDTIVN